MDILVKNEYRMIFRLIALLILISLMVVPKGINYIDHNLQEVSRNKSGLELEWGIN